jgi:hypothetical protein
MARSQAEMRPSSPRSSRISSMVARYSRSRLARAAVDRHVVGVLGDLHAQTAAGVGLGRAGDAARDALEHGAAGAAGEPDALGDAGDGAHGGVLAIVARNEQDALLVADVDGQRDVHRGEHDGVFKGDEEQCGHGQPLHGSTIANAMVAAM